MGKPQPVPEGFHTATPYLIVNDGARAVEFYEKAFGAVRGECMTGPGGEIRHAELKIGDSMIMIGQHKEVAAGGSGALPPVSIYLYVEDVDAMHAAAIAAGATERSPVKDQFYGNREGGVNDPFGIVWWLATRKEVLSTEEMEKRMAAR